MINPINLYSAGYSPYLANTTSTGSASAFPNSYSGAMMGAGMQMLFVAVAKRQLGSFAKNHSGSFSKPTAGGGSQKAGGQTAGSDHVGHKQTRQPVQYHAKHNHEHAKHETDNPPVSVDEPQVKKARPGEIHVIQKMLRRMHMQDARYFTMQQSAQFNDYLMTELSDYQTTRSIQMEGGTVLRKNDDHFLVEDADGNRYTVARNAMPATDDSYW